MLVKLASEGADGQKAAAVNALAALAQPERDFFSFMPAYNVGGSVRSARRPMAGRDPSDATLRFDLALGVRRVHAPKSC